MAAAAQTQTTRLSGRFSNRRNDLDQTLRTEDKKKPRGAKGKEKGKTKIPLPPKRYNTKKDSVCHHYHEVGHWRRNYLSYHAELKKRKNASIGLRGSIKLKHGALSLYVGNGMRVAVEAIRSFDLVLPSGLIIVLDNFHFAPTIIRGVVLIFRSLNNGYIHTFTNYGISVSKDNVFYFNAIPRDGFYEIDIPNLYPNDSSMYNRDGILQPTHDESLKKCKSCMSRKMARKPFSHQVERAKDLLGLLHYDACGPFRNVSREGASYFITFIDDFGRYCYVYLMKYKHEVFKTFKVFQNEVENQLGKKIKAIRSDRGGEYLSHEFVYHMKSCGIVSQLTPPYTPQHNGVYERRNQTLLDMVRSMLNLTTLPKSFWRYALESAARILNMIPTKKVERTPYEIWHGKAPKSIKCIFVGYPEETMGYYFCYPPENKIFVARNVGFFKNNLMVQEASGSHGLLKVSESKLGLELFQEHDIHPFENTSGIHDEIMPTKEYELEDLNEPPNYKAALSNLEFDIWIKAMNTEMKSMKNNQTDMNGYTQTYSVDYGETFSRVVDIRAIRILLAMATFYDYEIWSMDVKIAFFKWLPKRGREATFILGIKIIRDRFKQLISLSQSAYLERILKKFRMENSKKGYTPMVEKPDYRKSQGA
nr:hypothetical protein [Tanacetum cinerariifolium]